MIRNDEDFEQTRAYIERLQSTLLEMRRTHTPHQYEWMSRSFLKELAKAQRDVAFYLALPAAPEPGQKAA